MFEIQTLADSDLITEPGFYRISLERHHNQPCDGFSVTSGTLRKVSLGSPADVWAFHPKNPDRFIEEPSRALVTGAAMAALIEGGEDELRRLYLKMPEKRPNRPTKEQIKRYDAGNPTPAGRRSVEFWAKVENDPREPVYPEEWATLIAMAEALKKDPAASAALGGIPEITMAWRDEHTGIWCLSRPDQIQFSGMAADYKKMATQGRAFTAHLVDSRITQHRYFQQMAFAAEALESLGAGWPETVGVVCQCAEPPYHVILRAFDDDALLRGRAANHRALSIIKDCIDNEHWPGPGEHVGTYRMPEWLEKKIDEQDAFEGGSE